jgi:hypothetical protein
MVDRHRLSQRGVSLPDQRTLNSAELVVACRRKLPAWRNTFSQRRQRVRQERQRLAVTCVIYQLG